MDNDEKKKVVDEITKKLYQIADDIDWMHLNIEQKRRYYEKWTEDREIGGKLATIVGRNGVRVYLKDSVMKTYVNLRRPTIQSLLTTMSINCGHIDKEFEKPQAVLCNGNHLYTLTIAKEWKNSIMLAFERACDIGHVEKNTVFIIEYTTGRFVDREYRDLIEAAAKRLDIGVHWLA